MRAHHRKATCHPGRPHAARGLCFECYQQQYPKARRAPCHPGRIIWARGLCKSCYNAELLRENPGYAERQRKNNADWVANNYDRNSERAREHGRRPEVKARNSNNGRAAALSAYGLSLDDERRIIAEQGGCGICGGSSGRRRFDIDHDHATLKFRGFLCHRCNKGLGLLGDNREAVEKALAYLQRAEPSGS